MNNGYALDSLTLSITRNMLFHFKNPQNSLFSHPKPTFHLNTRAAFSVTSLHSAKTEPPPPEVESFWRWLSEQGVVSPKSPVRPATVPEGLGLVAQRDIAKNEVVLEVPNKFWINPDTVAASEIGGVCSGLKPWISVALFLIREKKREDSPWRVYLDILPDSTDSTVFWSEEELAELQGSQLLSTTLGVKEYVQNEYLNLEEEILLPHKQLFAYSVTLDDFLWAFGILRSRAFSRLRGQNLVLIPLADLINHSPSITTEDYAYEIKGPGLFSRNLLFSLRSPVPVKAGEQVLIQYDLSKSNSELALDYGFVESKSDRNAYTLTLEIPESDPFSGDKLDIAESNGLGETAYFDIVFGRSLPPAMLPYLRLVALRETDAFLLESIFRNTIWGHLELPVSRANEELICRVVRDACKTALSGYHTTIEEDEQLLQEGNLDPRLRIAVGIRAGEKRVLQQIDRIFKDRELELDELEYYQERRLKDLGLVGEQGEIIFWEPK
ncbi:N-methyltransferase [Melia azedarach]|uniref:N-methyltransferase n=1 Tax=Melia azedarach TaxID=155640 RepID=A0ACC1XJJ5_MELAZ|nr:N-methyltransferase [Melia azedarach]